MGRSQLVLQVLGCKVVLGRGREGTGQPGLLSRLNGSKVPGRGGLGPESREARVLSTQRRGFLGSLHGARNRVRQAACGALAHGSHTPSFNDTPSFKGLS